MGPERRLKLDREVERMFREGKKVQGDLFDLFVCPRTGSATNSRLAVRVPKRAGNAVARNRIKRLAKESFRLNQARLKGSVDMLVLIKPAPIPGSLKFERMEKKFLALCQKSGLVL